MCFLFHWLLFRYSFCLWFPAVLFWYACGWFSLCLLCFGFWNLWDDGTYEFWKILFCYLFKYFFLPILTFLLWNLNYTHIKNFPYFIHISVPLPIFVFLCTFKFAYFLLTYFLVHQFFLVLLYCIVFCVYIHIHVYIVYIVHKPIFWVLILEIVLYILEFHLMCVCV